MYSLVLLTALAPGSDVTPAPVMVGAPVSYGCCGMVVAGCTGCSGYASCHGCWGSCHGGLFHGGGLFRHKHKASCYGCTGYSCSGFSGSCYGCWGSCYGIGGSCHGCTGCLGCVGWSSPMIMSYGMGVPGMASTNPYYENGGYWGTPDRGNNYVSGVWQGTPYPGHLGGYGGFIGGGSAWGPPVGMPSYSLIGQGNPPAIYGSPNAIYTPVATMTPPGDGKTPDDKKPGDMKKPDEPGKTGMGASLKFVVPADAKLYVDGRPTTLTGTERVFSTPPLAAGQKFYYDVKAELMVNGIPVVEEKRVIVEAGANVTETFAKVVAAGDGRAGVVAGK